MVPPTLFVSGAVATLQLIKEIYVRVQSVRRYADTEHVAMLQMNMCVASRVLRSGSVKAAAAAATVLWFTI